MTNSRAARFAWSLRAFAPWVAVLLVASSAQAADESAEKARSETKPPIYVAPSDSDKPAAAASAGAIPFYVPPELGSPLGRIGASTRGAGRRASVQLLAPDHLGFTTDAEPTLYWFLAQPTTSRIEVAIHDETSTAPLVQVELPTPATAGIHAFRLSDHGAKLRPDADYQWFVSLVPDPEERSQDFVVGAWIRRRDPTPALRQRLAATPPRQVVFVYAESGMWYDAIAAISRQIDAAPGDTALRQQRAALLEQVGLSEVAAYDRQTAQAP